MFPLNNRSLYSLRVSSATFSGLVNIEHVHFVFVSIMLASYFCRVKVCLFSYFSVYVRQNFVQNLILCIAYG